jgi:CheY-like chemotaxis protein
MKKTPEKELSSYIKSELVSPLEVIRISSELLIKGVTGRLLPEQADFIDRILKQSEKARSIAYDLIDILKLQTGFDLAFVNLEVKDLLDTVLNSYKNQIKLKGLTLTLSGNLDFKCNADGHRISQVFKNLIELSLTECEPKSEVIIKCDPIQGHRRHDFGRTFYKMSFRFKGRVLLPNEFELLFERKTSLSKPYFLNMPILKQIMLLHKGSISYQKIDDNTNEYAIVLPEAPEVSRDMQEENSPVLIVGQDSEEDKHLSQLLSKLQFTPQIANSVEKAFEILKNSEIALIFFDYNPLDVEFNSFLDNFNKNASFTKIPLIMYCEKQYQKELTVLERFYSDVLLKPCDSHELKSKVRQYVPVSLLEITRSDPNKKLILLLDDDPVAIELVKNSLSKKFHITVSKNPYEALIYVKQYEFACVILEVEMPMMDGIEMISQIRQVNSTLPVVFSVRKSNDIFQRGASIFGVSRVLKKPFTEKELKETILEVCGG